MKFNEQNQSPLFKAKTSLNMNMNAEQEENKTIFNYNLPSKSRSANKLFQHQFTRPKKYKRRKQPQNVYQVFHNFKFYKAEEKKLNKHFQNYQRCILAASRQEWISTQNQPESSPFAENNEVPIFFQGTNNQENVFSGMNVKYEKEFHLLGISFLCKKGIGTTCQDNFFVIVAQDIRFFGIFDGHGPFGDKASAFVQCRMAGILEENQKELQYMDDTTTFFKHVFHELNEDLKEEAVLSNEWDLLLSGVSVTIVIHNLLKKKLIISYCGNSMAILGQRECKADSGSIKEPTILVNSHTPEEESESKRIYSLGGEIRRYQKGDQDRVCVRGKVYPGIPITRSIGDEIGSQIGVLAIPETEEYSFTSNEDSILVIGSEGLWNALKPLEVIEYVYLYSPKDVKDAGKNLYHQVKKSFKSPINPYNHLFEDLTFILVFL